MFETYSHLTCKQAHILRTFFLVTPKMPKRCVAAHCNNITDSERNISMHKIPEPTSQTDHVVLL